MNSIQHHSLSLKQLKVKFGHQIFAIPEIQRNYVWEAKRVAQLLDSIYYHYPIGIGLLWETNSSKNVEIRPNNKTIIPSFNLNNKKIEFVIDGQQRLSSLYGIMFGISPAIEKTKTDFTKFFLKLKRDNKSPFLYSNKLSENSKGYIKVTDIFNYAPHILINRYKLNLTESKEIRKCWQQFQKYKFHFLTIHTNSIEEVRETFIRINSQGMTVQRADTLFAKTTKIGLKDLVEATRRSLINNGFNKIDPKYFIYTLALASGETRIGGASLDSFHVKFEKKNIGKKEFAKTWKGFHNAFTMASDFLQQEYGIANFDLLPSANIFTMMSFFFYENSNKRASTIQKREIKKWFWHTALGERYSGSGFNKNIPIDVNFFKKLAKGNASYKIEERINPWDFLNSDYRKMKTSAVAGYFLFLRSKKPCYLDTGGPMLLDGAASMANRKDRHHIFPQNLLRNGKINSKWINSIVNICLLAANENQSISDQRPRDYLLPVKKNGFFNKVAKSHLIPVAPNDGVWNRIMKQGFIDFINQRAQLVIKEIENGLSTEKVKLFEDFNPVVKI